MSTNLHFIKTVEGGSDISALDVDNVFSDNFDVYFITHKTGQSSVGYIDMQLLDSSGSVVTTTTYDLSRYSMPSSLSYSETRVLNNNMWARTNYTFQNAIGGVTSYYIFNPYNSDRYTYVNFDNGFESQGVHYSVKGIGVERTTATRRGFRIRAGANFSDAKLSVFGVKK